MSDFLWTNFFKKDKDSTIRFLSQQILFSTLTRKELRIVQKIIHPRSFFAGETIFKPGSNTGMYMIIKGHVQIFYEEAGTDSLLVSSLREGDFFGELALAKEKHYHKTSAKAEESCELLGLFKPELMSLIQKTPRIGSKILLQLTEVLGVRLQKAGEKLIKNLPKGAS